MRILWFANNPSLFSALFFGGAWISSLERIIAQRDDCTLGVAFEYDKPAQKEQRGGTIYYPLYEKRSRLRERYIDSYTYKYHDQFLLAEGLKVIDDFKPDVIHVWGSEWCFGLLAEKTRIPVVIHMQGCWSVYHNVNCQVSATRTLWDYMHETWKPQLWWSFLRKKHLSQERVEREKKILAMNRNFMGRTAWDKGLTRLFAHNSRYFFCSEVLRDDFIAQAQNWQPHGEQTGVCTGDATLCTLITVANSDMIKGYDLLFQTAQILHDYAPFKWQWKVIGNGQDSLWLAARKTGIDISQLPVTCYGQQPGKVIMEHLLSADMFVHTSFADNSPNAICEAQYLGLPVITTNVGGIPSLFDPQYDRNCFVPCHDPYYLASQIIALYQDKERQLRLSKMNSELARARHNKHSIEHDLFACYEALMKEQSGICAE